MVLVADLVAGDYGVGYTLGDVESGSAIVQDFVVVERIAIAAVLGSFLAKVDAAHAVARDGVVPEFVVGVLVADGDSVVTVVFDDIIAELAVTYAPAQVQADVAVVVHMAALDDGICAARAGMNAVAGLAVRLAVQHMHVVGDL